MHYLHADFYESLRKVKLHLLMKQRITKKTREAMMVNNQPNPFEFSEADTCREFVTLAIQAAG